MFKFYASTLSMTRKDIFSFCLWWASARGYFRTTHFILFTQASPGLIQYPLERVQVIVYGICEHLSLRYAQEFIPSAPHQFRFLYVIVSNVLVFHEVHHLLESTGKVMVVRNLHHIHPIDMLVLCITQKAHGKFSHSLTDVVWRIAKNAKYFLIKFSGSSIHEVPIVHRLDFPSKVAKHRVADISSNEKNYFSRFISTER
ncbi:hypothetical protein MT325_M334R [Paramecium bursaria chlorella virus MT325]|uniref:Uncharacterized protein M334R n=1 Tax=Paramecium bursaria Chlorella virus MT325 TaxID=346932 RepID=A7IU64_PBCVM|nr:hypothetical protein MT325_M334R [Paramecium bursaria chlorella virus MT325]